jgi:glycosyltransferase involved in cell wall biosynthesis
MIRFTIAIPNRNNEKYLISAINSVLNQTCQDFAFIISDNYSTDASLSIINQYDNDLFALVSPPSPLSYADHLDWIASQIQTPYVIFLAGDDILHPHIIESYLNNLLSSRVSPALICSPFFSINSSGYLFNCKKWHETFSGLRYDMARFFLQGPLCNISSVAWDVSIFTTISYPIDLLATAGNPIDWYLYIKVSLEYPILLINQPLLYYRIHSQSTGNSNVLKHTSSCKELFNYLLQNELRHQPSYSSIALSNMLNFNSYIYNKRFHRFFVKLKNLFVLLLGLLKYRFSRVA